jgi:hypothetical protein
MVLHLKVWESRSLPGLQSADNNQSLQRSMRSRPHRASPWPPWRRRISGDGQSALPSLRSVPLSKPSAKNAASVSVLVRSQAAQSAIEQTKMLEQNPCRPKTRRVEHEQNINTGLILSPSRKPNVPSNTKVDAGWSSPVARQAHNLKVAGSNPAPATKTKQPGSMPGFLRLGRRSWSWTSPGDHKKAKGRPSGTKKQQILKPKINTKTTRARAGFFDVRGYL